MIKAKTVCVKCKHHKITFPKSNIWSYFCKHPDLERIKGQHPVTGKTVFVEKPATNVSNTFDDRYPYCQSINEGNCKYYEKSTLKTLVNKALQKMEKESDNL